MPAPKPQIAAAGPWGRDDVYLRFLEAAETFRRLPSVKFPRQFGNAMPQVVYNLEDIKDHEVDKRGKISPPNSAMIRRAEETLQWSVQYLAGSNTQRCLWGQVTCRVMGRSFAKLCRSHGWSRTTAYRRLDEALSLMTAALNRASARFEAADIDNVAHLVTI